MKKKEKKKKTLGLICNFHLYPQVNRQNCSWQFQVKAVFEKLPESSSMF